MLGARNAIQTTGPVHAGFKDLRQPLLRGDPRDYVIAGLTESHLRPRLFVSGFALPISLSISCGFPANDRPIRWPRLSR